MAQLLLGGLARSYDVIVLKQSQNPIEDRSPLPEGPQYRSIV
jgi:hypothetical protein